MQTINLVLVNRTCKKCGVEKELNAENFRSNGHSGFRHDCRECEKAAQVVRYAANREEIKAQRVGYYAANREEILAKRAAYDAVHTEEKKARNKEYYAANREEIRVQQAASRAANPEKIEVYRSSGKASADDRLRRYRLSPEAYQLMLLQQQNACGICKEPFLDKTPHVDHCHTTGKIRELLCHNCNVGLGHFQDSVEQLQKAIQYLLRTSQ